MLKSLHLKNWRSIREATIEFSPTNITVLIGANASGKTNIICSLYFLADARSSDLTQTVYRLGGGKNIKRLEADISEPLSIEAKYELSNYGLVTDKLELFFSDDSVQFKEKRLLRVGNDDIIKTDYIQFPQLDIDFVIDKSKIYYANNLLHLLGEIITKRTQLLAVCVKSLRQNCSNN